MNDTSYLPGDPRAWGINPDFMPVLVAEVEGDGRWIVQCPYCHRRNAHTPEVGFRSSHCRCDGMTAPGRMNAYVIAPPGAFLAPYMDLCHDHCQRRCMGSSSVFTPVDLEPHWNGVLAHYVCEYSYGWTMWWSDAPQGRPAQPDRRGPGKRCALYRHFDENGVLLYVGISESPVKRGKQHARTAEWVRYAKRIEAEWFDSRSHAEAAERRAILLESPVFNVAHVTDSRSRIRHYLNSRAGWAR